MGDNVIEVRNLGKKYVIQHEQERYQSLRDTIAKKTKEILHPSSKIHTNKEEFWALKDINFDIKQGERVGIIGRNGAGKSTLLKVMSRITEPSTGSIKLKGRVASLLEVGTGFHPELTGRENIYLNGAIIGMSKAEIKSKFDEIVDFAGVEKFLDTPVKRYSSGMYVRLAFAVAAHLEPEILIVDEVLAVGDMQFQQKCIGKMSQIGNEGRTVIFVSHNMAAIQSLCDRGIILEHGQCIYDGTRDKAIDYYYKNNYREDMEISQIKDRKGSGRAKVTNIRIYNKDNEITNMIKMGERFSVELEFEGEIKDARVGVLIGNTYFKQFMRAYTDESYAKVLDINSKMILRAEFESNPLVQGTYNIHTWLGVKGELIDYVEDVMKLIIIEKDIFNTGKRLNPDDNKVFAYHKWYIKDRCDDRRN